MNPILSHKKIFLFVIVLALLLSFVLPVVAKDARASWLARLEQLARIKDDVVPVEARPGGLSRLEELARIKDHALIP